jgi:large subunit ribosomal protein L30
MKIKLVRSLIGRSRDQVATAKTLGLKGIGDEAEVQNTPSILGKIDKIKFLLEVSE